jgi:hypothetical protein
MRSEEVVGVGPPFPSDSSLDTRMCWSMGGFPGPPEIIIHKLSYIMWKIGFQLLS